MVVGLIGRLNTIKEEAKENTEPPIKQSLKLVGLLIKMIFDVWLGQGLNQINNAIIRFRLSP